MDQPSQPTPGTPPLPAGPDAGGTPPLLPGAPPPVIGAAAEAATSGARSPRSSSVAHQVVVALLNLCLGLFLADALVSLVDDSCILLLDIHVLGGIRGIIFVLSIFTVIAVYGFMGLTPSIPKRLFLPVTLFGLVAILLIIPGSIYFYDRMPLVGWGISMLQVIVGLGVVRGVRGGWTPRGALVPESLIPPLRFTWRNLGTFALVNVGVLLPVTLLYLAACAKLAVDHFSGGFLALHPDGMSVQVRKYVRNDGKTVLLIPMSHIGESSFYGNLRQSFPTNSTILLEGVTDNRNLLTNKISYERLARSLGLSEQKQEFTPLRGDWVRADVDVEQFAESTIQMLNVVMFIHSQGLSPENLMKLIRFSPPPEAQNVLFDDLLRKRNRHLLEEIKEYLTKSDYLIVPWGALHIPEIAQELEKSGFGVSETQEYVVIRFRSVFGSGGRLPPTPSRPAEDRPG